MIMQPWVHPPAMLGRRRGGATYLPAEAGSVTAWTMSVDSASRTLVRNSVFLAPGQPAAERRVTCH